MEETDAQLHLKKRARRRLVGAVAFVALVAVALPMIMDHEPKQVVQDVEIRIPGQDEKPFAPKFATAPVERQEAKVPEQAAREKVPEKAAEPAPRVEPAAKAEAAPKVEPTAKVISLDRSADKAPEKPQEKAAAKPEKPVAKPLEKPAEKPVAKESEGDAKRAAALLAGKAPEPTGAKGGEHIILIGAFANDANVKTIRNKLGELGIKAYTEPLDSPQGRKTRVRAGPFPNRDAAEKALDRMKRIGVSGVVTAKQ